MRVPVIQLSSPLDCVVDEVEVGRLEEALDVSPFVHIAGSL